MVKLFFFGALAVIVLFGIMLACVDEENATICPEARELFSSGAGDE